MKYTKKILKKVGLSDSEVKVYIAGLSIGPSSAEDIARRAEIKRPLVYHTLQLLEQKGLVSKLGTKRGKLFTMEPPKQLDQLLKHKHREIDLIQDKLVRAKSELNQIIPTPSQPSKIRFYEGMSGVKTVAEDTLTAKTIYAMVSIENVLSLIDKEFIKYWMQERQNRKIVSKTIWSKYEAGLLADSELQELKIAPKSLNLTSTVLIYDNKVAIFPSSRDLSAFVIENEAFAITQKSLFEEIWNISTKFKP